MALESGCQKTKVKIVPPPTKKKITMISSKGKGDNLLTPSGPKNQRKSKFSHKKSSVSLIQRSSLLSQFNKKWKKDFEKEREN